MPPSHYFDLISSLTQHLASIMKKLFENSFMENIVLAKVFDNKYLTNPIFIFHTQTHQH